ncbi:response regulator receiver modulated diguanylate cyclase [Sinobacterium caligoides]|uniref:diguanylate cyclase n=1 Tax=Sinobacterium caligoides TaxID=933926 RepID=A0A3N2DXU6_9GAMM|nr:diguanylate cyclase [Sinobacterium caligoides]ROS04638.1 response regulator receiver modulated diguanylate cyclase [Sinobacterium caligoides]
MSRILVVDDNEINIQLLQFELDNEGHTTVAARSGREALSLLRQGATFDLILLDLYMPLMSGIEVLRALKADPLLATLPVIMVTASDLDDSMIEALDMGADDYVTKPFSFRVLAARMRTSLRLREVQEKLRATNRHLNMLATTDALTSLTNRRSFMQQSDREVVRSIRHQQGLVMAIIDVDHFKRVNDCYGHAAGDKVLISLAKELKGQVRECDILGRIGGEEFAICMPQTETEQAVIAVERLREAVESMEIDIGGQVLSITLSIGLSQLHGSDLNLIEIMREADLALYQAKNEGRNRCSIH